ncbi:hypothetical protein ABIB82_000273 [Bradyrhizobium sp. i1.8.4]|uniref:hypothetical protein n=1 Tax=unclassified Bradyrhizobium TaxID=2631580 RepID=UPI003D261F55
MSDMWALFDYRDLLPDQLNATVLDAAVIGRFAGNRRRQAGYRSAWRHSVNTPGLAKG